ncbi:MAG: hypothetical protein ABII90_03860 [Bacteroidota bacterium]
MNQEHEFTRFSIIAVICLFVLSLIVPVLFPVTGPLIFLFMIPIFNRFREEYVKACVEDEEDRSNNLICIKGGKNDPN